MVFDYQTKHDEHGYYTSNGIKRTSPFFSYAYCILFTSVTQKTQKTKHPLTNDPFLDFGLTRRLWSVGRWYRRTNGYQTRTVRGDCHIDQPHVAKMVRIQDLAKAICSRYQVFIGHGLCVPFLVDPKSMSISTVPPIPRYERTIFTTSLPSTEKIASRDMIRVRKESNVGDTCRTCLPCPLGSQPTELTVLDLSIVCLHTPS